MFNEKILQNCAKLKSQFNQIPTQRKALLDSLSDYIAVCNDRQTTQIIVICTHNSRRSHIGQLMLLLASEYYKFRHLVTFSAGTETTAFNIRAVKALEKFGFEIKTTDELVENPIYEIKWRDDINAIKGFSKTINHPTIPKENFAALMVCSEADKECPIISGCNFRLSLPFDDPKEYDGTELEESKYDERCIEIGREMFYVLSRVAFE